MRRRPLRLRIFAAAALALALAACQNPAGTSDDDRLVIVATTTILADLTRHVGGERVDVATLVPAGGEVHTFNPRPSDVGRLAGAVLIVRNGLGLDDWLLGLVADANSQADVVAVGEELDGVTYRHGAGHEDDVGDEADEGDVDPHLWLNAAYARLYVDRIADELARIDPTGAGAYRANAAAYSSELEALHGELASAVGDIPEPDRRVVSFHDAFGYFAEAYGLEIIGTVVDAPGQDPSAGEVARLIDAIRESGARAILAEAQFPTDLAQQIADEAGIQVVRDLYSDSIGPPPADTYVGLMRLNVERIVEALR